jgi:uncharacterized protein YndB with AHSA1/START domain
MRGIKGVIMLLKSLVVVVVVIAAVLLFAATKPNAFRIERSLTIAASPEKIFPLIDDFHHWSQWAPQDREDPTLTRTYSGAESGVGAISNWKGNGRETGQGRMTIERSKPNERVMVKVEWDKPMATVNTNWFILQPAGSGTKVTWTMEGPNLYMMKVMSVFIGMDRMMGKHFEDGLQNLKSAAEK